MTVFSKLAVDDPEKVHERLRKKEAVWPPPISFDEVREELAKNGKPTSKKDSKDNDSDEEKFVKISGVRTPN